MLSGLPFSGAESCPRRRLFLSRLTSAVLQKNNILVFYLFIYRLQIGIILQVTVYYLCFWFNSKSRLKCHRSKRRSAFEMIFSKFRIEIRHQLHTQEGVVFHLLGHLGKRPRFGTGAATPRRFLNYALPESTTRRRIHC